MKTQIPDGSDFFTGNLVLVSIQDQAGVSLGIVVGFEFPGGRAFPLVRVAEGPWKEKVISHGRWMFIYPPPRGAGQELAAAIAAQRKAQSVKTLAA